MSTKNLSILLIALCVLGAALALVYTRGSASDTHSTVTLSGTFECLPHRDQTRPTEECTHGLLADDGSHYAVDFGESADEMNRFQAGMHIKAEGVIVMADTLNTDQWNTYDMKGIFRISQITGISSPAPQAKINIQAVCEGALAYMSFPDAASADTFVAECKEGKHPEVIEHYKAQLHTDGAAI